MTVTAITDDERRVLSKTPTEDAYWTADIAKDARFRTAGAARTHLDKLLKKGLVEKAVQGGTGKPSSWRRTKAGSEALLQA